MQRVRIKYCGITNLEDALAAIALGVDALGFVFHPPSPRYVTAEQAAAIIARLPPLVSTVGLFVNRPPEEVMETLAMTGIDLVQYHGDETPAACAAGPRAWIKAVRVRTGVDVGACARDYRGARALLVDTFDGQVYGGSGRAFDWSLLPAAVDTPLILAGGLTAANVAAAIRQVRPYAVDVSGGIEASKGRKDHEKMHRFVTEVRTVERET
ncbi:MAG: phosphoribosylanthranilate isomerase [Gammaproteobacteria bacterium]